MPRNFIIVGTQRTGSTALFRSLNFHPDVACGSEWTQDVLAHRKLIVAERALSGDFSALSPRQRRRIDQVYTADKRWLGFKLLFRSSGAWMLHPRYAPALCLDRLEAFIRWIAARPEMRIIHVTRNDAVDWLKSKYLADRSRAFAGKGYPEGLTVRVPVGEAVRRLRAKAWIDTRLASLSASNPYIRVSYEEFLDSDRAIVGRLMQFLDCDLQKLGDFEYRKQQRQSKGSARDYIRNYDQLVSSLRDARIIAG